MKYSFCIHGRDDNFMGNFRWRITVAVNALAEALYSCDLDAEIVICDWGSKSPMKLALSDVAQDRVTTVHVPEDAAKEWQQDAPFHTSMARNVALRHSLGDFLVSMDADIIWRHQDVYQLDNQVRRLGSYRCFAIGRRQLPYWLCHRQPTLETIWQYVDTNFAYMPMDSLGHGYAAPAAAIGMHRYCWDQVGGFDQEMRYWGWQDVDLVLRATQRFPLTVMPFHLLHMEHYAGERLPHNPCDGRKVQPTNDRGDFRVNGDNWGTIGNSQKHTSSGGVTSDPTILPKQFNRTPLEVIDGTTTWSDAIRDYAEYYGIWRYLELGFVMGDKAATVARWSPGAEMVLVVNLDGLPLKNEPTESYVYALNTTLQRYMHAAATHLITGGDRWKDLHPGPFDLVVVPSGRQFELPPLSSHGLVLITEGERYEALTL